MDDQVINWLLEGDVSIQYQVWRDLLGKEKPDLQNRILTEGWGATSLPKEILKVIGDRDFTSLNGFLPIIRFLISVSVSGSRSSFITIFHFTYFKNHKSNDGGVNPGKTIQNSDVCINGMALNYASYFQIEEVYLHSVVDFILSQLMPDRGFNCMSNRSGAIHSSLHTTLSVLEGIEEFFKNGYSYRKEALEKVKSSSIEFILLH
ncbi:MAG: hypothetical protein R2784_07090 [Saprospiraceae bacterium]